MIQYDTVWYDTIWYGAIRYSTIRYDTIQYNKIWYGTYDTIQYDMIWNERKLHIYINIYLINIYIIYYFFFFLSSMCDPLEVSPLWWFLLLPCERKHHFNTSRSTLYLHGLDFYCRSHQQQGSFMRWEQKKWLLLNSDYTPCARAPPTILPGLSNKCMKTDWAAHTFTFIYCAVHIARSLVELFYLWILSCKVFGSVLWRMRHFFFAYLRGHGIYF